MNGPGLMQEGSINKINMKAGIWLDNHKAFIVYLSNNNGKEKMIRVDSAVEDFHIHGGAAAPSPYGAHAAVSESKLLERKKQQLNKYFKTVKEKIKGCDAIYICGPAGAKLGLGKEIVQDKALKEKLTQVESCDSMTENQIIAQVKAFFKE